MLNTIYNEDCQTGIKRILGNYVEFLFSIIYIFISYS